MRVYAFVFHDFIIQESLNIHYDFVKRCATCKPNLEDDIVEFIVVL